MFHTPEKKRDQCQYKKQFSVPVHTFSIKHFHTAAVFPFPQTAPHTGSSPIPIRSGFRKIVPPGKAIGTAKINGAVLSALSGNNCTVLQGKNGLSVGRVGHRYRRRMEYSPFIKGTRLTGLRRFIPDIVLRIPRHLTGHNIVLCRKGYVHPGTGR